MDALSTSRRDLFAVPLLAALPVLLAGAGVEAAPDPAQTITVPPDGIRWQQLYDFPPNSSETAPLVGKTSESGLYFVLVKWYPGYMSAPHWYETDRNCVVVSGTWWVTSGDRFNPEDTIPMPAGSFVRRVAKTPHYDGVKADGKEPAVIAICGIGPITFHPTEEGKPSWRKLT